MKRLFKAHRWWLPAWWLLTVPPVFVCSWFLHENTLAAWLWGLSFVGTLILIPVIVEVNEKRRNAEHIRRIEARIEAQRALQDRHRNEHDDGFSWF